GSGPDVGEEALGHSGSEGGTGVGGDSAGTPAKNSRSSGGGSGSGGGGGGGGGDGGTSVQEMGQGQGIRAGGPLGSRHALWIPPLPTTSSLQGPAALALGPVHKAHELVQGQHGMGKMPQLQPQPQPQLQPSPHMTVEELEAQAVAEALSALHMGMPDGIDPPLQGRDAVGLGLGLGLGRGDGMGMSMGMGGASNSVVGVETPIPGGDAGPIASVAPGGLATVPPGLAQGDGGGGLVGDHIVGVSPVAGHGFDLATGAPLATAGHVAGEGPSGPLADGAGAGTGAGLEALLGRPGAGAGTGEAGAREGYGEPVAAG
ncbi:unnamed protein product, partial [Discosporangium mesarthrocarpum]